MYWVLGIYCCCNGGMDDGGGIGYCIGDFGFKSWVYGDIVWIGSDLW